MIPHEKLIAGGKVPVKWLGPLLQKYENFDKNNSTIFDDLRNNRYKVLSKGKTMDLSMFAYDAGNNNLTELYYY